MIIVSILSILSICAKSNKAHELSLDGPRGNKKTELHGRFDLPTIHLIMLHIHMYTTNVSILLFMWYLHSRGIKTIQQGSKFALTEFF